MSIVIVQQSGAHKEGSGCNSIAVTLNGIVSGNDIIVCLAGNDNAINTVTPVTVSDGTNTYTKTVDKVGGGVGLGANYAAVYRAKNVTGGSKTITVTFTLFSSGTDGATAINVYEVSGLDQSTANDGTNSSANGGLPLSAGNITPSVTGDLIVVIAANTSSIGLAQTINAGAGFVLDFSSGTVDGSTNNGNLFGFESQINGGTSAVTCAFGNQPSSHADSNAVLAAAFKVTPTHTISGNAGVGGATVSWSGASSGSVTADGSGNYTTSGLLDGSYTITPSKTLYTFTPASSNQTLSGANITGVNFTASSYYSQPDCRVSPFGPNSSRTVQGTLTYDVQTSSNSTIPGTDSRAAGAPVDVRIAPNIPENSRTAGTFGPNE